MKINLLFSTSLLLSVLFLNAQQQGLEVIRTDKGAAITGWNQSTTEANPGIFGRTNSDTGNAIFGLATHTSGSVIGVQGQTPSTNGVGVYGYANASGGSNVGVRGLSNSTIGTGVKGIAAASSGTNFGVYGETNSPNGYGLYSMGRAHIAGNLSKSGGSFKIDHPLAPTEKYLYHSFVESPDMMNIYNGNITTDVDGYATIDMPAYFMALNSDFRYQLTVIREFAQAIVAEEINNNKFIIRTDKPNITVSWQVTGIRQDAYARRNRIQVEEDKPLHEIGTFLHPEVYDMPNDLRVVYGKE